jgi:hypothetical protein
MEFYSDRYFVETLNKPESDDLIEPCLVRRIVDVHKLFITAPPKRRAIVNDAEKSCPVQDSDEFLSIKLSTAIQMLIVSCMISFAIGKLTQRFS